MQEQIKLLMRPAVVVQNDDFNESNIATCTVIPLTSNMLLSGYTPNVVVPKTDSGLSKDSVVIIPLVRPCHKNCVNGRDYLKSGTRPSNNIAN